MTAPGLILLAPDTRDRRTLESIDSLTREVRRQRTDLRVERAVAGPGRSGFDTAVRRLVRTRHAEIVVVPLLLVDSPGDLDAMRAAADRAMGQHPGLEIRITDGLGLEPTFLEILDERLRSALRLVRARELDALVLAADGSTDPQVSMQVARLGRIWGANHRLPVATAHAAILPPSTGEAVRAFRREGRRNVAVAALFLTPGGASDRAAELAVEAGAVAVSTPLGAHPEVARTVLARYAVGAVDLVPV
jgi:sirohydrochlorin ferrochelatase